jgi:hypothetical protein
LLHLRGADVPALWQLEIRMFDHNGEPGIRRKPFYCAFLIDPDGNNLEAGIYLGP